MLRQWHSVVHRGRCLVLLRFMPVVVTTLPFIKMATILIVTPPIPSVYPFLKRYFVKGVLSGSPA